MGAMASRRALVALSLVCTAAAIGCHSERVYGIFQVSERSSAPNAARGAPGPADRFISVRGKKKTKPGVAFVQLTPDVWAPFDVSLHTGLFDPAQTATANGTRVCLEIDNVGFTVYYDVCATWAASPAGWTVAAFTGAPTMNLPGSLFLDGAEIELRAETDGTTLRFHARNWASGTWEPVAQTPWPGQNGPLEASFGVAPILKGTLVGFDDPTFSSAPPPIAPTGAPAVAAAANEALLEGLAAFLLLDGPSPDFAGASTQLGEAADALGVAQTLLAGLPQDNAAKKAGRSFAKGEKKLGRAEEQVAEQDADGAVENLGKAAAAVEKGVLLLVPQPFPSNP
jgi:hypothetical protein